MRKYFNSRVLVAVVYVKRDGTRIVQRRCLFILFLLKERALIKMRGGVGVADLGMFCALL